MPCLEERSSGTSVHNIEIRPGSGGKVARAAGQQAIVSNREAGYALIKMPSGEIRRSMKIATARLAR